MVLITGMTGTSGSAFVDVLQRHNYSEHFRVLVRKSSNLLQLKSSELNFEIVYGDLNDEDALVKAMTGCNMVFHIAVKGKLKEVANAAIKSGTVSKCILVSSTSVYSAYRKTEYLSKDEQVIKAALEQNNISWVLIRPTMIFGTLNDHNISQFMRWLDKYPVFPIVKNGKALLQPVHRYDLAEAYYLLLTNQDKCNNEEFVVSGKESKTLKETLTVISGALGKKTIFVNVPFFIAQGGVHLLYVLTRKKIDYREKLYRLTEDRSFEHTVISDRFGYSPKSFEERVSNLSELYLSHKSEKSVEHLLVNEDKDDKMTTSYGDNSQH